MRKIEFANERQKANEVTRRHEMFARMRSEYLVARLNQKPPVTKQEYDEDLKAQKSGKPPRMSSEEWREQAQSRARWNEDAEAARFASISPYHYEEAMYFPDHYFDEPKRQKPETAAERKARLKAMDVATTSDLIEAFEGFGGKAQEA